MSTIDTSTWNPDANLNTEIEGIPLNSNASIAQTWQALRVLMAAVKGDGDAIKAMIDVMQGATASADGASGLVPKPLAGDQGKVLKGDGTWGALGVSSVSGLQTALDAKAADSATVHKTGNEPIGGTKTFSSAIVASADGVCRDSAASYIFISGGSSSGAGARLLLYGQSHASNAGNARIICHSGSTTKSLDCSLDGTLKWNGQTIQTTSDERLKTPLSAVPDDVLDAWEAVGWGQFQYLDAVAKKGESARLHMGLIAQRVKAVFEERGLDACQYGILCYDEEGGLWTVRYAEALAMESVCQRRRADRLEARIAALEVANA